MVDTNTRHFQHLVDISKGEINREMFSDPDIYQQELKQIFARCSLGMFRNCQMRTIFSRPIWAKTPLSSHVIAMGNLAHF